MPNGVVTVDAHDDAGRLVRHTHTAADQTVLADDQYVLDGLGNPVCEGRTAGRGPQRR